MSPVSSILEHVSKKSFIVCCIMSMASFYSPPTSSPSTLPVVSLVVAESSIEGRENRGGGKLDNWSYEIKLPKKPLGMVIC